MSMNAWKAAAIALITISSLWNLFIDIRSIRSADSPTPDNVKDVYDAETYQRWRAYHRDNNIFDIVFGTISCQHWANGFRPCLRQFTNIPCLYIYDMPRHRNMEEKGDVRYIAWMHHAQPSCILHRPASEPGRRRT